jgi:hypothetical protein
MSPVVMATCNGCPQPIVRREGAQRGGEGEGVAGYIGGKAHDIDEAYDRDD